MARTARVGTLLSALLTVACLTVTGVVVTSIQPTTANADPVAVQQRPTGMVTAESLPTAQINGVVWTQLVVGNTVYVGGSFTKARPAGSPAGTGEVDRNNVMSYDLTTGQMTSFAPNLNGQVKAFAVSPDRSRLYVAGQFTSVNGTARYRLAAFDVATGELVKSFAGGADYTINALVVTNDTVYAGGAFSTGYSTGGGGGARSRLAAFSTSSGALLGWAPTTDNSVSAMVMGPGNKIIIGGSFATINGVAAPGSAALDPVTGASLPWKLNTVVKNNGASSAILSLSTDGTSVYGGGYKFGGSATSTLEGTFKVDGNGEVQWIEDCHGDTYGVYAGAVALFQVGHSHYCGNNMGWPQPAVWDFNRATAYTKAATGTLIREPLGYVNWKNSPSPSLMSWFPLLDVGTFTGKSQAAWSVTGNSDYVVLGGEFPTVNGVAQQGLARFAVEPIAAGKRGAEVSGSQYRPTLRSTKAGTVNISFLANWDRDDRTLTYKIIRDGVTGSPIYTTTVDSSNWERPAIGFTDTGLAAGSTHGYRIQVTDGDGNITWGDGANITVATSDATVSTYGQTVVGQGASLYWPLDDTTTNPIDLAGYNSGVSAGGVTAGTAGGVSGTAMTFNGTNGKISTSGAMVAPNTFSMGVWFKTTSTTGGRIAGFSDLQFDSSGHRDRQVYLSNAGKLSFGVYGTAASTITSAASYNDGNWHQAVATLGANGMALYVDGLKVGNRTDVTSGEKYVGYWRLGGDNNGGWSGNSTSAYVAGQIDEFSVFPTVLSTQQVLAQYAAAGRTSPAPADAYGAAVYNDDPQLFWRLGDTTGTVAVDSAAGANPGTYNGTVTKGAAGAVTANTAVSMNGTNGFIASNNSFANPQVYSVEAWVKTTASSGRIVGFGNSKTTLSTSYDRQLYLQNDGKVVFGAGSPAVTLTSPAAINNGNWHHLVATQGPSGMTLWVDGQAVANNAQTSAMNYNGYWRAGGDRATSSTASYFNGTVDEVAVYPTVLTDAKVLSHFTSAGGQLPNQNPTATFTTSVTNLNLSVNGSASADADGTIAGYSWNWGDSTTAGTGATASHTYAAAGTYQVILTVTDNRGGTSTTTQSVTATAPPANQPPVASFTATPAQLSVTVDGRGSSDPDGSVATYSWNFGDGATATGAQPPAHTYAASGTYPITLTVTDNAGGTGTSSQNISVTAPPPNAPPTAAFTQLNNGLTTNLQSTSTDSDGQIVSWQWNFGDNSSDSGEAVVHTFAASGTYPVTLTVTDNGGAVKTATQNVTVTAPVTPNQPPVAAFTSSVADLKVTVNGSGSTDPDGSISSYSWDFGDGSTDQVTTPSATHTYLAAGTYPVTLTVTDNSGATDAESGQVTVTSPGPVALASDLFGRTVVNGFGAAETGGTWSVAGGGTNFSVNGGTGNIRVPTAGSTLTAALSQVTSPDLDITLQMAMDKPATGGGLTASVSTRKVGNSEYRVSPRFTSTGGLQVQLLKVVSGTSTVLTTTNLSTFGYTAGEQVSVRINISGTSTVTLQSKVWKSSTTEPAAWQSSATDSTNPLTSAGNVQLINYLSGSSTNAPVVVSYDNLKVYAIAP